MESIYLYATEFVYSYMNSLTNEQLNALILELKKRIPKEKNTERLQALIRSYKKLRAILNGRKYRYII